MNNFLELKNISKHFNIDKKIKVLKNLSYNFNKGKMYSLMGPSGSGKSTLLNLISLIDRPSLGSIKFNDKLVNFSNNKNNDIFRAKNIGIVYQQNNLLADFTALENVYLANLSINNDKDSAITKAKVLLKKIGLSNRLNHFPSQLSGGECQRVAIARAIINDPEIILADEPTGSLDLNTAKEIFELLNNQKKPNRLIIFATHNRFFADKADCLLEITDGSVKTINV
ncbi:ABC transporter ATP-binding protein [Candidatus Pelagibacter sp.]|jgi:ABC-type lipoprotein export system ATPase subunit|nr:ABC transporter ATP-binding protein [Candidatus Pelagibacter sp.]MDC0527297.1 ABC transporter ATP-binding protein [Candidatus Pelagibacter sp.]MDC0915400.1 ABC transporter ATP-binding protein [Candidatus Pelagibacter sp.]